MNRTRVVNRLAVPAAALALTLFAGPAHAAVTVFLDFTADLHNGTSTATPNGVADWIDELNQATSDALVASFNATERAAIETNILTQLQSAYAGYNITFTPTDPGGIRDRIYFGVDNTGNPGLLGFAPFIDYGNIFVNTVNMLPRSFGFFIESGDARATQIAEISRGFSGTAAHELGHSFGLLHQHSYSNPGITPATYANTGGLQNLHIMATGSTGLTEAGRESERTFSPFGRAMFDITSSIVGLGQSLVTNPVPEVNESGDAGATTGTAVTLAFQTGESSGYHLALRRGDLDVTGTDIDLYRFTAQAGSLFSAELFSLDLFVDSFDGRLRLLAADGTTVLASNDNPSFSGNTFNMGGTTELNDPYLNNIPIPVSGTYFLEVSVVAGGAVGDDYELLVALSPIPEPASAGLLTLGGLCTLRRRRL